MSGPEVLGRASGCPRDPRGRVQKVSFMNQPVYTIGVISIVFMGCIDPSCPVYKATNITGEGYPLYNFTSKSEVEAGKIP